MLGDIGKRLRTTSTLHIIRRCTEDAPTFGNLVRDQIRFFDFADADVEMELFCNEIGPRSSNSSHISNPGYFFTSKDSAGET